MTPLHLRPQTTLAERVLLPGDPGRALRLAQALVERPLMYNHNRGLWGYTGKAADGEPLTIQATGMGGPSMAIVSAELISLGARALVRIGTATAIEAGLPLGAVVPVRAALTADGTSRALHGREGDLVGDPALTEAIAGACEHEPAVVCSTDLLGEHSPDADVADLSTAALLAIGARHGARVAAVLLITCDAQGERLAGDDLEEAEQRLGRAGAAAFGL